MSLRSFEGYDQIALNVLNAIAKTKGILTTEINDIVGGSPNTVKDRLDKLFDGGLIERDKNREFPYSVRYSLTHRGETFYSRMVEAAKVLEEEGASQ